MAEWLLNKGLGQIAFLLMVNVLLLLAGNVMEPSSIVLIMAPILFPVAMKLGIDPVHFGIMIVVNMEIGLCHPPVGLNLYVASGITKMGITELTVAVWPWLLTMLVFLVMVTLLAGAVPVAAESDGDDVRRAEHALSDLAGQPGGKRRKHDGQHQHDQRPARETAALPT